MLRLHGVVLAATVLAFTGAAANAEDAAPGATPAIPEKTAPGSAPATSLDAKPGTLSDKLGETHGVIRPTGDIDPAMHKAAPQTGTTPVLKPGEVAPQSGKGGLY